MPQPGLSWGEARSRKVEPESQTGFLMWVVGMQPLAPPWLLRDQPEQQEDAL